MTALHKILIANRGEIAVRVIRSAKQMGYRTVAVFSDADDNAPHVQLADEAVNIGPAAVSESYLRVDAIIDAATKTAADAIHPGYGFLSENADFARACQVAGITFIGPSSDAIELMGSKRLSKLAMIAAGVPCVPGYEGDDQSDERLVAEAERIGFPIMVKASAGGGGRGMRLVDHAADLPEQLRSARSEALSAFGSDELILEKAVQQPRHVEIQVFADSQGNAIHLAERDCSVQRRHQKVVEEAPSPFVDDALRQRMGDAAVAAAKACNYCGAGTVEFLVDAQGSFYFLEMNTRLQVEHPVTEMVTGVDLVEWQLRIASGEPLPMAQSQLRLNGHAVEVRLYAEEPRQQFMPQTGRIARWQVPQGPGLRLDSGISEGQLIGAHYDPMLAKLICWAPSREEALRRLASMLQDSVLLGINNNLQFLQAVLRHPSFIAGNATTAFIAEHGEQCTPPPEPGIASLARAAAVLYECNAAAAKTAPAWRRSAPASCVFTLAWEGQEYRIELLATGKQREFCIAGQRHTLQVAASDAQSCVIEEGGVRRRIHFARNGKQLFLDDGSGHFIFDDTSHAAAKADAAVGSGLLKASMDGAIVDVVVAEGERVSRGQTLVVLEAMKMEHPLKADMDGTVATIHCQAGDQVKSRQLLVELNEEAL